MKIIWFFLVFRIKPLLLIAIPLIVLLRSIGYNREVPMDFTILKTKEGLD